MKVIPILPVLFLLLLITGCGIPKEENDESWHSKVPVTVVRIENGTMTDEEDVIATSAFLDKAIIKAPVAGYLDDIRITAGEYVSKNQLLYSLKTKEAAALHFDSTNPLSFSGLVNITSSTYGTIISADHSKGDYVLEGDQLCTIALPGSLTFIVEVPYELNRFIVMGRSYSIELPDGKMIEATVKTRLPGMTGASQTQRFTLQPKQKVDLPENMIVKVRIVKNIIENAIFLPKSCVLSDEVMKQFWVMKVINDSLAVRVKVTCGLIKDDKIQIIQPLFSSTDLILSSGNYGLGDSATIEVTNREK